MKKIFGWLLTLCLLFTALSPLARAEDAKLNIVSTIFPPYDFVRNIAGDRAELHMLLAPGNESHSFEPSPRDIITMQNADVFIYIGGETDAWVDRILESMDTSGTTILSLVDMVDTVEEEIVEGMEHSHDEHDHDHGEIHAGDVGDRPLSDWAGAWQSVYTLLSDRADAETLAKWETNVHTLQIDEDSLRMTTPDAEDTATYAYAGFALVEGDHGTSVWYQFEGVDTGDAMPSYIMFSDHGTGADEAHGHDEDHEDEHDEDHHDELPHFHLRYGDDGFDALLGIDGWAPTYFPEGVSAEAAEEALSAHGSGQAEDDAHEAEEDHEDHEAHAIDEHVWTSPRNARVIVRALARVLSELDAANAEAYQQNANDYDVSLQALDQAFAGAVENAARTTILFGDRFPFRYLADDYGLDYYAAFPGCATDTEASAATVAFLIDKTLEENLPAVFTIEFSNGIIADTIAEATGAARLAMHSCHNVSRADFEGGVGYLDLMTKNVEALREALH